MNTKLRAFWWGRVLPPEYKRLASLSESELTTKDMEILEELKKIVLEAHDLGIDLGWGHQITKRDVLI